MSLNLSSISSKLPDFSSIFSRDSSSSKNSLLLDAIVSGNSFEVERLTARNKHLLTEPLSDGQLPLHAAVRLQQAGIVKYLMDEGCLSFTPDAQGMTALDYAILNRDPGMLQLLLPAQLVQNMNKVKSRLDSFDFAKPEVSNLLRQTILGNREKLKGYSEPTDLAEAIYYGTDEQALAFIQKNTDLNRCDAQGFSPMHIAAALGRANLIQQMAALGGDLFTKNKAEVAPADLMFNLAADKDPYRFDKAKLILTFIKVGSVLADRYIAPSLSEESSKLLHMSLFLLNVSTDFILTYQAAQHTNLNSLASKMCFWASSVASIPLQYGLLKLPGGRVFWDLFRAQKVCGEAFARIKAMYHNYKYDPGRSVAHIVHQAIDGATTLYQVKDSLKVAKQFLYKNLSQQEIEIAQQTVELGKKNDELAEKLKIIEALKQQVKDKEVQIEQLQNTNKFWTDNKQKLEETLQQAHNRDPQQLTEYCRIVQQTDVLKAKDDCQISINNLLKESANSKKEWSIKEEQLISTCTHEKINLKEEVSNEKSSCTQRIAGMWQELRDAQDKWHRDEAQLKATHTTEKSNLQHKLSEEQDLRLEQKEEFYKKLGDSAKDCNLKVKDHVDTINTLRGELFKEKTDRSKKIESAVKYFDDLKSNKQTASLFANKLYPTDFEKAVCTLFGHQADLKGKLNSPILLKESELQTKLDTRINEVSKIFDVAICKEDGINEICQKALITAAKAKTTILTAMEETFKSFNLQNHGKPTPYPEGYAKDLIYNCAQ